MAASGGSGPEVRLVELTKLYSDVRAVDSVTLDIGSGEFFSLLGPSGCGKTTTLRMIGGFEAPTSGRIELQGRDVTQDPPERRPVNMVFQSYALFPHLNVFDNVAFGLRRRKVPQDEVRRRVSETLYLVRLTGFDRRRTDQLSGGQAQRVALARALVNRPTVLLLDEPLGALDLKLRKQLQVELKRIQTEVGITFVYVTHDQEEALALSDRIAVMRAGHVEQLGTPEELYDRPATRFVAGFIGTMNLLSGEVVALAGRTALIRLRGGEQFAVGRDGLTSGQTVEVAVRPEVIEVRPSHGEVGAGAGTADAVTAESIAGHVEQAAYLGTSISYLVRTASGQQIAAVTPRSAGRLPVGSGVAVRWSPEDALLLPEEPETGKEAGQ
jgi:spermidine/putrescine transport system ATP-binding protein